MYVFVHVCVCCGGWAAECARAHVYVAGHMHVHVHRQTLRGAQYGVAVAMKGVPYQDSTSGKQAHGKNDCFHTHTHARTHTRTYTHFNKRAGSNVIMPGLAVSQLEKEDTV